LAHLVVYSMGSLSGISATRSQVMDGHGPPAGSQAVEALPGW
jgi:hypothetical protein